MANSPSQQALDYQRAKLAGMSAQADQLRALKQNLYYNKGGTANQPQQQQQRPGPAQATQQQRTAANEQARAATWSTPTGTASAAQTSQAQIDATAKADTAQRFSAVNNDIARAQATQAARVAPDQRLGMVREQAAARAQSMINGGGSASNTAGGGRASAQHAHYITEAGRQEAADAANPWTTNPVLNTVAQAGRIPGGAVQGVNKMVGGVSDLLLGGLAAITDDNTALGQRANAASEKSREFFGGVNAEIQKSTDSVVPQPTNAVSGLAAVAADVVGEALPAVAIAGLGGANVLIGTPVSYLAGALQGFETDYLEGTGNYGHSVASGVTAAVSEIIGGKLFGGAKGILAQSAGEGLEEVIDSAINSTITGDRLSASGLATEFGLGAIAGGVIAGSANAINANTRTGGDNAAIKPTGSRPSANNVWSVRDGAVPEATRAEPTPIDRAPVEIRDAARDTVMADTAPDPIIEPETQADDGGMQPPPTLPPTTTETPEPVPDSDMPSIDTDAFLQQLSDDFIDAEYQAEMDAEGPIEPSPFDLPPASDTEMAPDDPAAEEQDAEGNYPEHPLDPPKIDSAGQRVNGADRINPDEYEDGMVPEMELEPQLEREKIKTAVMDVPEITEESFNAMMEADTQDREILTESEFDRLMNAETPEPETFTETDFDAMMNAETPEPEIASTQDAATDDVADLLADAESLIERPTLDAQEEEYAPAEPDDAAPEPEQTIEPATQEIASAPETEPQAAADTEQDTAQEAIETAAQEQTSTETAPDTQITADVETNTTVETQPDTAPETEPDADPEAAPSESEQTATQTAAQPAAAPITQTATQAQTATEPETEANDAVQEAIEDAAQAQEDTQTNVQVSTQTALQTATQSDTGTQTETATQTQTRTETATQTATDTETETQTQTAAELWTPTQTRTETVTTLRDRDREQPTHIDNNLWRGEGNRGEIYETDSYKRTFSGLASYL